MAAFPTTRWSLIQAGERPQADLGASWSELVRAYRPVILGYFRRSTPAHDAEDLTQDFILRSISEGWWARADRKVGSFRGFLLMLLKRFLIQHRKSGYARFESTGATDDDSIDGQTPEQYFDLQFALCLTRNALSDLQRDYESDGRGELFNGLQQWLAESPERGELIALGEALGIAPNTLAVQLKRLRARLQKTVRMAMRELSIDAEHAAADLDALREGLASPELASSWPMPRGSA
ncbi:MAG: sigma factor [Lysobacteraceae bacterium]